MSCLGRNVTLRLPRVWSFPVVCHARRSGREGVLGALGGRVWAVLAVLLGMHCSQTVHAGVTVTRTVLCLCTSRLGSVKREVGSQMAERLGNRAINQKLAGSIPGRDKLCCVLGRGTSPYLPRGNVPVVTVSHSG